MACFAQYEALIAVDSIRCALLIIGAVMGCFKGVKIVILSCVLCGGRGWFAVVIAW